MCVCVMRASENNFGAEGGTAVAYALTRCTQLTSLNLGGNVGLVGCLAVVHVCVRARVAAQFAVWQAGSCVCADSVLACALCMYGLIVCSVCIREHVGSCGWHSCGAGVG